MEGLIIFGVILTLLYQSIIWICLQRQIDTECGIIKEHLRYIESQLAKQGDCDGPARQT